jgi:hypothetical protein
MLSAQDNGFAIAKSRFGNGKKGKRFDENLIHPESSKRPYL